MKTILKAIGFIVLVVVLAALVLYFLNDRGYLSGDLSEWIDSMTGHVTDMTDETKEFLEEEGILTPKPATTAPAASAVPTAEPTAAPSDTAEPVTVP